MLKNKPKEWRTPSQTMPGLYYNLTTQSHILMAGTTGSGKSTLLNTFIYNLLLLPPTVCKLCLIDPKGCELVDYADTPHTIAHACELPEIVEELQKMARVMDARFKEMKRKKQKQSTRPHIYIIIDEYIDIKTQAGKVAEVPLIRLIAKGRASNIHIILCTQRPTRDIISGAIVANFPARVALRCSNRQESRNIIDTGGAELLPLYGQALYKYPGASDPVNIEIKQTTPKDIAERVQWWKSQKAPKFWGLF